MRWLLLVAVAGCGPAEPLSDLSDSELCGGERVDPDVSPPPLWARLTGAPLALGSSLEVEGAPLPGALADFKTALGLGEGAPGLKLRFEAAPALAAAARRCGVALEPGPEAYLLVVRDSSGGPEVVVAGEPRGQAHALAALRQLVAGGRLQRATVFDAPRVPRRLVLEGFYGAPWSWAARREMMQFAAAHRFNSYYLAPKADLLSGLGWRTEYPDAVLRQARSLAAFASERGVELCWAVSPGTDIVYSSPAHRAAMVAKLDSLVRMGVRCFALAFDDINKVLQEPDVGRYPSFAAAQVDFVTAMAGHLQRTPGTTISFVPTDYSTRMMQEDPAYTATIATLDAAITIGWTGPEIVSSSVTAEDAAFAAASFERPVALGDNYPVRDNAPDTGPLMLQPIDRREVAAFDHLQAYGGNGMVLPRLSMLALASLAELGWNPSGYRPERALRRGAQSAAGSAGPAEALAFLADHAEGLNTGPQACAPSLRAAVAAFEADAPAGAGALRAHLARMRQIGAALAGGDPRMLEELRPWSTKLQRWGALGERLVELRTRATRPSAAEVDEVRTELARIEALGAIIADSPMKAFVATFLARE